MEGAGETCHGTRGRWQGLTGHRVDALGHTPARPAPLVWRAPEGPKGTDGLRDDAPNEVRPPSLAGSRTRVGRSQPQASPDWRPTRGLQGLAGLHDNAPSHTPAPQAPPVWRAAEGPAAVPVGGGRAWPGFETTRRAKLAARTASGRAADHRHTQRPGPPAPGRPAAPQATTHGRATDNANARQPERAAARSHN